jgi:hypothetical protein
MTTDFGRINSGDDIVSKQRIGDYKYEITCYAIGYTKNQKTGTFKITEASPPPPPPPPSPKITTEIRIKPWPSQPEIHGEFMFWNSSGQIEGSLLNLKIQVSLNTNATSTNELTFYKSGIANLWKKFSNISSGDILEISSFPSNGSLIWSFSDNPDYLSLKIIEGNATKDGQNIPFEF